MNPNCLNHLTPANTLSSRSFAFLRNYIHAESGIVVEQDKQYLIEARLLPVIRAQCIESLDALSGMLAGKPSPLLSKLVVEAMTTHETFFFRDPAMFEALREKVLPKLFERIKRTRKLRIWSAAASSGQEAYSLAMLLFEIGKSGSEVEIIGTDISSQVLERAREAVYTQFDVNRGLPAHFLLKYFTRSGPNWQLKDEIRKMASFEQLNLRQQFGHFGNFDLVFCRNVLIYFDVNTKRSIVDRIQGVLSPGGMLALGCAETIINVHQGLRHHVIGHSNFYSLESE